MVDSDKAVGITISLYNSHIEMVKRFSKAKGFKYDAEAYQYIIDDFFSRDDKQARTDFILFIVIPFMFCLLTTIVNLSTSKVFDMLLSQGIYSQDFFILSRVFMIVSFGSIGVLISCVYWYRKKYSEQKEHMEMIDVNKDS
jgi:hypothetical protein